MFAACGLELAMRVCTCSIIAVLPVPLAHFTLTLSLSSSVYMFAPFSITVLSRFFFSLPSLPCCLFVTSFIPLSPLSLFPCSTDEDEVQSEEKWKEETPWMAHWPCVWRCVCVVLCFSLPLSPSLLSPSPPLSLFSCVWLLSALALALTLTLSLLCVFSCLFSSSRVSTLRWRGRQRRRRCVLLSGVNLLLYALHVCVCVRACVWT